MLPLAGKNGDHPSQFPTNEFPDFLENTSLSFYKKLNELEIQKNQKSN